MCVVERAGGVSPLLASGLGRGLEGGVWNLFMVWVFVWCVDGVFVDAGGVCGGGCGGV